MDLSFPEDQGHLEEFIASSTFRNESVTSHKIIVIMSTVMRILNLIVIGHAVFFHTTLYGGHTLIHSS
jgi:hypothetical protein